MVVGYKLLVKAITNSLQMYEKKLFPHLKLIFFKILLFKFFKFSKLKELRS